MAAVKLNFGKSLAIKIPIPNKNTTEHWIHCTKKPSLQSNFFKGANINPNDKHEIKREIYPIVRLDESEGAKVVDSKDGNTNDWFIFKFSKN